MEKEIFIGKDFIGKRIDLLMCDKFENLSRNFIQKLFTKQSVVVNDRFVKKNYRLRFGDKIFINIPEPEESVILKENIPLNIVYEDSEILVVNKKRGMVVHPAVGNKSGTLVNALMWHCGNNLSSIGGILRPGIVHRIDKDTTGLLVVAKTDEAFKNLSMQIKIHSVKRRYVAVVHGILKEKEGIINFPIGRSLKDRKKMAVNFLNGKEAITYYKVLKEYVNFSYVMLQLETGRTHQIRVHMAYINHPVVGDSVYGRNSDIKKLNLDRGQCLHSKTIKFYHYKLKREIYINSSVDEYFVNFLNRCQKEV